ncbi:hypothetical protein CRG98_046419 [Punica granatum]|uniref:glucan endo-1,3-beta-D-glucosidase n=1 Tax=Punica granatum TaxID=22663 RepID=A0A2I0HNC4_PUNGR|nr:hypothetical protein CRG98_046419 [Punica granatum]
MSWPGTVQAPGSPTREAGRYPLLKTDHWSSSNSGVNDERRGANIPVAAGDAKRGSDPRPETLAFCLFQPNPGWPDSGSGITYMSMFDAQVDAVRAALNSMRFDDIEIMVAETGWPYGGDSNEIGPTLGMLGLTTSPSGSETPVTPSPKSNGSWCIARSGVPDTKLQAALDYACGQGIDCRAIQPRGPCFEPNTFTSHAAYAMYLDYQHSAKGTDDCEFTQSAMLTSKNPSKTSFYISPRSVFLKLMFQTINHFINNK